METIKEHLEDFKPELKKYLQEKIKMIKSQINRKQRIDQNYQAFLVRLQAVTKNMTNFYNKCKSQIIDINFEVIGREEYEKE